MYVPVLLLLAGTALGQFVLETFTPPRSAFGNRGNFHGCDEVDAISCTYLEGGGLTILSKDADLGFSSQFDNKGCQDITSFNNHLLHVVFSGSAEFSVSLMQNSPVCRTGSGIDPPYPFPLTWDIVNAVDYAHVSGGRTNLYIPLTHFNIEKSEALGFAFRAFRDPNTATTFHLVEFLELPLGGIPGFRIPEKKPTGPLHFACTRPNSIAFGIDDGVPELAQEMMEILNSEGIKATFFVVGQGLDDPSTNSSNFYKEARDNGHQIALHSYTHPKIESLNNIALIDGEIARSHAAVLRHFGIDSKYFRPPYGTDGALTRQRLHENVPGARMIDWSVDIEDYIWATGPQPQPEKQTEAVVRDLGRGGTLFVAHYLYRPTITEFRNFITLAKRTGKQIMRIDQCLEDPEAPAVLVRGNVVDVTAEVTRGKKMFKRF